VPEDASPGTFVGHVIVRDPDRGSSGRFNCSVVGDAAASYFRLERMFGAEYHIVTSSALDRETQDTYRLGIECADGGPESLSSVKWLSVEVTDINDHAPEFDQKVYIADIYENNYNGKFVVQVPYYSVMLLWYIPSESLPQTGVTKTWWDMTGQLKQDITRLNIGQWSTDSKQTVMAKQ